MSRTYEVLYVLATRSRFMCPMNFNRFPMDEQTCKFQVSYNKVTGRISAKNLSDLVNESLTLSEEATVAASADVSRLSSPPPSTAPQIMHSISSNVEDGSSPISSTGATGELVQGTNTGDNSMTSSELQVREFKGANFGLSNSRKILPGPPPERLVAITNNMNSHLTSLLVCIDFSLFCLHDQNK